MTQPESLRVEHEHLDRGGPPIAEHERRTAERIAVEHLATQPGEPVDAAAKVHRLDRDQDPHLRGQLNHRLPRTKALASAASTVASACSR